MGCLVAAFTYVSATASRIGVTFDEPMFLSAGLERWRTGSHAAAMRLGAMPLAIDLAALPLYLHETSRGHPVDLRAELPELIGRARATTLLFLAILVVHGWLGARRLAGPAAGALAAALLACEPNVLAHASLATTDVAAAAGLLALVVHFEAGRGRGTGRRLVVPGLLYGLALLAKGSLLLLAPLALTAVEAHRAGIRLLWNERRRFLRELAAILGLGLAVAVLYCGSDFRPEKSFVAWARGLPPGAASDALATVADGLRVFPNGLEALVREIRHNVRGHGVYVLGITHPRAVWYYFPVALAIKLGLPVLALLAGLAVFRRRALGNGLLAAAALLLLFSVTYRVQIGVRLVLPLVGLLMTGLAVAAVTAFPERSRIFLFAAPALLALESASAFPDALRFTNALWGGMETGHLRLSDSNADWGQGLPALAAWAENRGVARLDVWYFGTDPRIDRPPFRMVRLHEAPGPRLADALPMVSSRYLAVGTTVLWGSYLDAKGRAVAAELRAVPPAARASTFLIYDVRALPR